MEIKILKMIESHEWDRVVSEIYNKPYCLQQQGGCKLRGEKITLSVPVSDSELIEPEYDEEFKPSFMEVNFDKWIEEDAKQSKYDFERNFYPVVSVVAQDLYEKGVLPAGEYTILISY